MPPSALDTIAATTPMRSCMAAARINEAGAFVQGMFRIAILPRATFTAGLLPRRGPGDAERSGFDQGTDVDSADFDALEEAARARMARAAFAFCAAAADDE